jgi:hypothetical protein
MAKKKPVPQKKGSTTNHIVIGLLLILVSFLTLGGILGGAGKAGLLVARGTYWLLGAGQLIIPIALFTGGLLTIQKKRRNSRASCTTISL